MHLGHRAGCERLGVERSEQLPNRLSQLRFGVALGNTGRVGRDGGLQLAQLAGGVLTDQVGAQAQHLPELDVRRAQLDQSPPKTLTVGGFFLPWRHRPTHQAFDRPDVGDPAPTGGPSRQPMAGQHTGDLVQAVAVFQQRGSDLGHGAALLFWHQRGVRSTHHGAGMAQMRRSRGSQPRCSDIASPLGDFEGDPTDRDSQPERQKPVDEDRRCRRPGGHA